MSIEKVKEALQKEKNRQVLLVDGNMKALTDELGEVLNRFASDLNIEAAKEGAIACIAAAKEACNPALSQAEYELSEMATDYETQISAMQTELAATIANAAALNEELTHSFESYNALQQEADGLKAQLEAIANENATLQNDAKATADALRTEVEQLKRLAQTYKSQYEAAIAAADTNAPVINMDNPAQPQYDPPAAPQQEQKAPKNIYEEAAALLRSWKGQK